MSIKRTASLVLGGILIIALAVDLNLGDAVASNEAAAQGLPSSNHYKCYQILDWGEGFEAKNVKLKDLFVTSDAGVVEPAELCIPVSKDGEPIPDKDAYQVCYRINDHPSGKYERIRELEVNNQFGSDRIWVGVPGRTLCLPSSGRLIEY